MQQVLNFNLLNLYLVMDNHNTFPPQFFEHLGKLFFAIASADRTIEVIEIETFKEVIKDQWSFIANKDLKQIEFIFDNLVKEGKLKSEACYLDFITYKNEHNKLFTSTLKSLILKTSSTIASSFSGRNKSELIILAKLDLELKRNIES